MTYRAQTKSQRDANALIGRNLGALRKERGFTQMELANKLQVSQAIVSSYERGRVRPHPDYLLKLAQLLDVSIDQLLGNEKAEPSGHARVDRRFARRLQMVGKLPKRDQTALLRTIDAFLGARNGAGAG